MYVLILHRERELRLHLSAPEAHSEMKLKWGFNPSHALCSVENMTDPYIYYSFGAAVVCRKCDRSIYMYIRVSLLSSLVLGVL